MRKQIVMIIAVAVFLAISVPAFAGKPVSFGFSDIPGIKISDASHSSGTYGNQILAWGSRVSVVSDTSTGELGSSRDIFHHWSDDGGLTWQKSELIATRSSNASGGAIALGTYSGIGYYHVAWMNSSGIEYSRRDSRMYLNDRWSTPITVNDTALRGRPAIAADDNGGVHIVWAGKTGQGLYDPYKIYYSRSQDNGDTFVEQASEISTCSAVDGCNWPQVEADFAGNVYAIWASGMTQKFSKRLAGTSTWTDPVVIASGSNDSVHYVSFAFSENLMCTSYGYYSLFISCSTDDGDNWTQYQVSASAGASDMAIDSAGVISLTQGHYFMRSSDNGLSWSTPTIVNGYGVGKLTVDDEGRAHILYGHNRNGSSYWGVLGYTKEQ